MGDLLSPMQSRALQNAYTMAFSRDCARIERACFKKFKREPFRSVAWKIDARAKPNLMRNIRGAFA